MISNACVSRHRPRIVFLQNFSNSNLRRVHLTCGLFFEYGSVRWGSCPFKFVLDGRGKFCPPMLNYLRWQPLLMKVASNVCETQMSTGYAPIPDISFDQLFDGRLKKYGIQEEIAVNPTERTRYLVGCDGFSRSAPTREWHLHLHVSGGCPMVGL
jgi:hypothetical protein